MGRERTVMSGLADLSADAIRLFAEAIESVSREMRHNVPPPRGAPFYALDYAPGDLTPLDVLSSRGIFRKYESALHIGAGLGAPARWWATHFGCSVLGIDISVAMATVAGRLTRRAGLAGSVRFVAADAATIPVRDRVFTHVWAGDAIGAANSPAALREAWRVLRPGAHFGLRVLAETPRDEEEWCRRIAAMGFVDVVGQPAARPQISQVAQLARRRLDRRLRELADPLASRLSGACQQAYQRAEGVEPTIVVFARRPA
ncbi:MAG TPA: class I SAM-dependent methyltransferase [Candidatus Binatia bacterium]|nr:class I SAM-dependent methyltransferase [Candidatus Binatia bacterium]